jgi:hypothetical protein
LYSLPLSSQSDLALSFGEFGKVSVPEQKGWNGWKNEERWVPCAMKEAEKNGDD